MRTEKKKWRRAVAHLMLIVIITAGQKVHSQEPGAGFPSSPDDRREQFAFAKEKPEDIAEMESKWMKKKLKLTKEQFAGVKGINTLYALKRSAFETAMGPKDDGNKKKISDTLSLLDKEKDEELRKILTEKQFELYVKKKPELLEKTRTSESEIDLPPPPPPGN